MRARALLISGWLVASMSLVIFSVPGQAEAHWKHKKYHYKKHHHKKHFHDRYCEHYSHRPYRRTLLGRKWIRPRVGVVVSAVPEGHDRVVVDGTVYYLYDGVYYKGGPAGYTVVPVPSEKAASAASGDYNGEIITINVPNANGSYMPIKLELAKDGTYIGPEGEVYPTKPELDQLASMYAK